MRAIICLFDRPLHARRAGHPPGANVAAPLFDIGAQQQTGRDFETKRLRSFQIDYQLTLSVLALVDRLAFPALKCLQ
jgi:hypothetical protein